jgi:hypothetical protein
VVGVTIYSSDLRSIIDSPLATAGADQCSSLDGFGTPVTIEYCGYLIPANVSDTRFMESMAIISNRVIESAVNHQDASRPDTSQPYFLDLIARIDDVTGERG